MLPWRQIRGANLHYFEEHVNDNACQDLLRKYAQLSPTSDEVGQMGNSLCCVLQLTQLAVQMKAREIEDQRRRLAGKEEVLKNQLDVMYAQNTEVKEEVLGIDAASQTGEDYSTEDAAIQTQASVSYDYKPGNYLDVVMKGYGAQGKKGKDAMRLVIGEAGNIQQGISKKFLSFFEHSSNEFHGMLNALQKQVAEMQLGKKQVEQEVSRSINQVDNVGYNSQLIRNEFSYEDPLQEYYEAVFNSGNFEEGELQFMAEGKLSFSPAEVQALNSNLQRRVQVYSFREDSDLEIREEFTDSSVFSRF